MRFQRKNFGVLREIDLDEKAADQLKRRGRFLFRSLMNLPGSVEMGDTRQKVLLKWIRTVKTEAQRLNVVEATEVCLGQWLAANEDGVWPTAFVCEALENILPSETLANAVFFERWRMVGHIVWMKTERLHVGLGNGITS